MEKVWNSDELLPKKIKSIMKITLLFLILGILHVSADTYAQKAQVTVEVKNGTFYDVVSEIEKQTEFMFFYKSEDIDNSKPFTIILPANSEILKMYDINGDIVESKYYTRTA